MDCGEKRKKIFFPQLFEGKIFGGSGVGYIVSCGSLKPPLWADITSMELARKGEF